MSTIPSDLWPLALHEGGHVAHAFMCGFLVDKVYVGRPKGYAIITYSLAPETLAAKWAESPILWAGQLMRVIGTIRAGSLFEGLLDVSGDDCVSLGLWREAYVDGVGTPQDWNAVYVETYSALLSWRQRASVQAAVKKIAEGLLWQGTTSREALMSILGLAGVQHVPEPYYRPLLPSPQRSPAPTSRQSASPRRPATAVPSNARRGDYTPVELESSGIYGLYRMTPKRTGTSFFVISKDAGTDRQGQLVLDTTEYDSEAEARRQFARLG